MRFIQKNSAGLIIVLLGILGLFVIKGCGDSSTGNEDDRVSGILLVGGKEIKTTYSDWPIPEGDEPAKDTTSIGFFLKIQEVGYGNDQLRIVGLEGADVGKYDNRVFPNCTNPEECKIYGKLAGEDLEIDINNNGRSYQATGKIYQTYDPYIEMTATYKYQNITIEYNLEGGRKFR